MSGTNNFDVSNFVAQKYVSRVANADTGDFITYDESKCNGCGQCNLICAANIWAVPKDKKTKLSPKYRELCYECAACYAVCEQDAIGFKYPKGGTGIVIKYG